MNNNKKKKILIVEDETPLRNVLKDKVSQEGFWALTAKDGEEGLRLAIAEKPDLILLDLLMPKFDGLKMLKTLRADSWGKDVPVYILTNVNQSKEISEAMNNKISKYIVKSDWTLEDIMDDIRLTLNRKGVK